MLAPPEKLEPEQEVVFQTAQEKGIPDPAVYSDWFHAADEYRRRLAVGTRRYSEVEALLDRAPEWENFLDPETGQLLTTDQLRGESPIDRETRVGAVRALIAQRRSQLERMAAFGFLT